MTKKQQQCPYCHHETGGKHCVLLEYTYLTSNDDYVEANVDIKDKSMFLNIGDYYKDVNDEINEFIQHKHIVDIKFSVLSDSNNGNYIFSALITYEEVGI